MDNREALESVGWTQPGDEQLAVLFYIEPVKNNTRSLEEGRPIFEEKEWISIKFPGSREERKSPVRQRDIDRFPRHYAAFKARTSQEMTSGTPLVEWTGCTRSAAEELKFWNISTVEQLASVTDQNVQNVKGMVTLKQSAIKWLEASKEMAASEALATANEKIDVLMARLEALESQDKPKPKRKRRTKAQMEASKLESAKKE